MKKTVLKVGSLLLGMALIGINLNLDFSVLKSPSISIYETEALAEYEENDPSTWTRLESYMCHASDEDETAGFGQDDIEHGTSGWEKVCESSFVRMDCDKDEEEECPDGRHGLGNGNY